MTTATNTTPAAAQPELLTPELLKDACAAARNASPGRTAGVAVVRFDALSQLEDSAQPPVVLVEGALNSSHADALMRQPPPLLLSEEALTAAPESAHFSLLAALLKKRSLLPALGEAAEHYRLVSLRDLDLMAGRASALAQATSGSRAAARAFQDVVYEVSANALLDAPIDATGARKYAFRRDEQLDFDPQDACAVAIGSSEGCLWAVARDRFGSLTAEPMIATIKNLGERARMNSSGGGAGLGMRRIVQHSEVIGVRVIPGRLTEFAAVVATSDARRRSEAKSLFLWIDRG